MVSTNNALWMPTVKSTKTQLLEVKRRFNEESIIDFIAGLSPWLAPLPSAVFVQQAIERHMNSGTSLAWIAAIVIETLGLTTTHTALAFHGWNRSHEEKDHAPFPLAVTLAVTYIITTLSLIGVLEAFPKMSAYAPLLFPVLAVVGAVNLAMRGHHNTRVKAESSIVMEDRQRRHADEDAERALRIEEKRLKMQVKYGTQNVTPSVTSAVRPIVDTVTSDNNVTVLGYSEHDRLTKIREWLNSGKKPQPTAWGKLLGCTRQQIYRDIEKLQMQGGD